MLQGRSLVILFIAVLLGVAAVVVANAYLGGIERQQEQRSEGMVRIAVARVPLDFGATITPEKVRFIEWPSWSVPDGAYTSSAQLMPSGTTHVVLRPMGPNEPILASKLSGEGGRATLAAMLRPDMRAFAVRVSEVSGVAGFVLPGDVVDVLVTRQPTGDASGDQITDILLQNIRVIAIDQDASDAKSDPRVGKTATLEVNQTDSQKLALAQQVGSLSLALKRPADGPRTMVETVGTEDLRDNAYAGGFTGPSATGPAVYRRQQRLRITTASRAPSMTVEVVRGTESKSYEVGRYVGF